MADLERILQQLHDSEINAGVQTFYDAGMRAWIGDDLNGIQAETVFNRMGSVATARTWPKGVTAASTGTRDDKPAGNPTRLLRYLDLIEVERCAGQRPPLRKQHQQQPRAWFDYYLQLK